MKSAMDFSARRNRDNSIAKYLRVRSLDSLHREARRREARRKEAWQDATRRGEIETWRERWGVHDRSTRERREWRERERGTWRAREPRKREREPRECVVARCASYIGAQAQSRSERERAASRRVNSSHRLHFYNFCYF